MCGWAEEVDSSMEVTLYRVEGGRWRPWLLRRGVGVEVSGCAVTGAAADEDEGDAAGWLAVVTVTEGLVAWTVSPTLKSGFLGWCC